MKLIQLKLLMAINKYGSFSRAAAESFISQSTVSLYMKSLENEIGHKLIERTNRGAQLTELGRLVLVQAEKICQAMDEIGRLAYIEGGRLCGRVYIWALPHICNTVLSELQVQFAAKHPHLSVELESKNSSQIVRELERREISFGVFHTCDVEPDYLARRQGELLWGTLARDELLLCVGEHNPLLSRTGLTLDDMMQYPLISYGSGSNGYRQAD